MSGENGAEEVQLDKLENMSVEDEEEEDWEDDYDYQDAYYDCFLDDSKIVTEDENTETIRHLLMMGMNHARRPQIVEDLLSSFCTGSHGRLLAKLIVEYVVECPPSNVEMVRRFQCVEAVLKAWTGSDVMILEAVNAALESEEPLKHFHSRNLYNFIRCLLDENVFDKKLLIIYKTRVSSLVDVYVDRLYKLVYDYHKMEAPISMEKPGASGDGFLHP